MRQGLKQFSNWPTYPQLYVNGSLIGGLDILKEMKVQLHLCSGRTESGRASIHLDYMVVTKCDSRRARSSSSSASPKTSKRVSARTFSVYIEKVSTDAVVTVDVAALAAEAAFVESLRALINSAPVLLFMKGSPQEPKCGFSKKTVALLREHQIAFSSFDILSDEQVRQGLKKLSNWPTYPQLYVKGSLIGGLDILTEMAVRQASASLSCAATYQPGVVSKLA